MQLGSEDYVNILKLDIGFSSYSSKTTPQRCSDVGEVSLSKDDPLSEELTMFPVLPTARNVLFPKAISYR